jgi:maleate isomerase
MRMMGWRGRIGFMVPPGNPTVEPEMMALAPPGVSLHFHRMVVRGATGTLDGQEERNRSQIRHLDETAEILAMVKPGVMVLAHTATSYTLGREGEAELVERLSARFGIPVITAFGSVVAALAHLQVSRVALGAPYGEDTTRQGKAHLEAHGFEVVNVARLPGVTNIYDETPERAYLLARMADSRQAQAVFLSGVGLPTLPVLAMLERDLGKPAFSSAAAMMWNALRTIGVAAPIAGYGSLLSGERGAR